MMLVVCSGVDGSVLSYFIYYSRQGGLLCLLLATSRKTCDRIFMKMVPKLCLSTKKIPLNRRSHLPLHSDVGISLKDS